jgi:hypothetical protein
MEAQTIVNYVFDKKNGCYDCNTVQLDWSDFSAPLKQVKINPYQRIEN